MATAPSNAQLPKARQQVLRILACLDRSRFSEVCVPHAVSLAKTFGSTITLLHVMQPPHEHAGPQTSDPLGWEISRQEARAYLERLRRQTEEALGQPAEVRLEQGHPAERIVDIARELDADLVVLGSHGESGVTPWNLGSTVQQVLAFARCSVFIAHSSAATPATVTPRHILVPLDGSLRAESALPAAARLATAHGAELLLVHVVREPLPTALLCAGEDIELARQLTARLEASADRYLEHLQRQLAHEGVSVRTLVARHANQHQCLLELSQREQADLIVLSAHGATCDSASAFGSVTAHMFTHSTTPLLVLQDLPESELHRAPDAEAKLAPPLLRASYAPESP